MIDIVQKFSEKIDQVFEEWKDRVVRDRKIESSKDLPETALGNSVPKVLEAIATAISITDEEEYEKIVEASLAHGSIRFHQGYSITEVAREYRLLRQTIFSNLEDDLLQLQPTAYNRAYRIIDSVVDEASAQCFKQFLEERRQATEKLQQQMIINNQELNRLLRLNQENFSQLAHEIKTPLNAIMGYSQLMLRQQQQTEALDSNSIDSIERVLRASRLLLQLVNGALEFSRSQSGKITPRIENANVRSVIDSAVELIEPLASAKNLQLTVDYERAPKQVITDSTYLHQVFTNLLSNAVRYTETGSISIRCESNAEEWSFIVQDTGIGISPTNQSRIFEPFSRSSDTEFEPASEGSTGLGLAIVSQLVKHLKGRLELESTPGEGSTFTVILPLSLGAGSNP